ncbi:MAG: sialidase family protein [Paludibacter sp.]
MNPLKLVIVLFLVCFFTNFSFAQNPDNITISQEQYQVPVLKGKTENRLLRLKINVNGTKPATVSSFKFNLSGTTSLNDIKQLKLYNCKSDTTTNGYLNLYVAKLFGTVQTITENIEFSGVQQLNQGANYFWLIVELNTGADLLNEADVSCTAAVINDISLTPLPEPKNIRQKFGIALRQHNDDNVHTYRIPGLTTSKNKTLLAVYDVRRDKGADLQGNINIGLSRSTDGGNTWQPMQIVLDMKTWGGLPEKYNGVSDACILSDDNTGAIYVAGLWMHGVLDENGQWKNGLTDTSTVWNHQWRNKGSQPGFDVKQTSQFLIVKSTDDGLTWSEPVNLTKMCKREAWWLWAPAPGHGISLKNGTLLFPTQGRDEDGKPFSNITYSTNSGLTWKTSSPADDGSTTECMAVELNDGKIMLNMRANSNWKKMGDDNGRAVAVTSNLGRSWKTHPTSRSVLNEPVCMACIHKHNYTLNGVSKSILLFSNPNSKSERNHLTIKVSFDEGNTWPEKYWILLDEWNSAGYSCITSIDENSIGILYEGSGAQLVFQKIDLRKLLGK